MDDTYYTTAAGAQGSPLSSLLWLVLTVVAVAGLWKMFTKAGKPGWAAIVPIYNLIVLLEIVGRPVWWIVLFLIPFVNIVAVFLVSLDLAKAYGKGAGWGVLAFFVPFIVYPYFGFSANVQYVGKSGATPVAAA